MFNNQSINSSVKKSSWSSSEVSSPSFTQLQQQIPKPLRVCFLNFLHNTFKISAHDLPDLEECLEDVVFSSNSALSSWNSPPMTPISYKQDTLLFSPNKSLVETVVPIRKISNILMTKQTTQNWGTYPLTGGAITPQQNPCGLLNASVSTLEDIKYWWNTCIDHED